jgi:hypothetical protein
LLGSLPCRLLCPRVSRRLLSGCNLLTIRWFMEVDLNVAKEAIYWRGLFINRYSGVEYAIAELVSRSFLHLAYASLGQPPFGPAKKLKRLQTILSMPGPIQAFSRDLKPKVDEFTHYEEHRHFMAHAIMVPKSATDIAFRMYDHREGVYSVGELQFEMQHLKALADLLGQISVGFTSLVARICKEIPLPEA